MNINFKTLSSTFTFLILGCFATQGQNAIGKDYTNQKIDEFLSDFELKLTIKPDSFHFDLFHAALFHLSNNERRKDKKKQLLYFTDLEKSAKLHSTEMSEHHFFSHTNSKSKKYKTPAKRMFTFNDNYRAVGENIVSNNLIEYSGKTLEYSIQQINEETIYIGKNGKELDYSTYINLAKRLTKQWMDSPPHKKNILSENYTLLGCACALEKHNEFIEIKCTQNFGDLFQEE